jgi:hypothetical protein
MVASVLIILFSLALLVYWVRSTCLLLVAETKTDAQVSYPLFSFPRIRAQLRDGVCDDKLQKALARDYTVLTYLISRASLGVEARLLVWDYRLMRCWYALSSTAFPAQGRKALQEMTDVVAALARQLRSATAGVR